MRYFRVHDPLSGHTFLVMAARQSEADHNVWLWLQQGHVTDKWNKQKFDEWIEKLSRSGRAQHGEDANVLTGGIGQGATRSQFKTTEIKNAREIEASDWIIAGDPTVTRGRYVALEQNPSTGAFTTNQAQLQNTQSDIQTNLTARWVSEGSASTDMGVEDQHTFQPSKPYEQKEDQPAPMGSVGLTTSEVDPVAGFLEGLGIDFGGRTAFGPYQDWLGDQAWQAREAYRAKDYADWLAPGSTLRVDQEEERLDPRQFGSWVQAQGMGGLTSQPLTQLSRIAGIDPSQVGGAPPWIQQYLTPSSVGNLQSQGVANLLTGALRGAGLDPSFAPGIQSRDVQNIYTQYVSQNPQLAGGDWTASPNFLNFAANQLGLNRFF